MSKEMGSEKFIPSKLSIFLITGIEAKILKRNIEMDSWFEILKLNSELTY